MWLSLPTPNALLCIAVCSVQDALLGIVSNICECPTVYVLLKMPYLELYLYTKLGRSTWGRELRPGNAVIRSKAFGVGHTVIQGFPR